MKNKVIVIAEAGVNHNGNLKNALKLIEEASKSGCDYIKFQSFNSEQMVSSNVDLAEYQSKNVSDNSQSQLEMLKGLEIKNDWYEKLISHCQNYKIGFLSSAFDIQSLEYLISMNLDFIKIPSGEITNYHSLEKIAKTNTPVLLSTGMSTVDDIQNAINVLFKNGFKKKDLMLLHCKSIYPTPYKEANLKAIKTLSKTFKVKVGYSDHTLGIEAPIAAVALGAKVIEKHFTLDKNLEGPDHKISIEPHELKKMVSSIRIIESLMSGSGEILVTEKEEKNKALSRKSIHLVKSKSKGEQIEECDLIMKRPGNGISPMDISVIIGKKLSSDLSSGTMLIWDHIYG